MFENIIIDMIGLKIPHYADIETLKENINSEMSKHFASNAYNIRGGKNLYLNFVPSRYYPDLRDLNDINDVNMENITIDDLNNLIQNFNLPTYLINSITIEEIHLCKNILLQYPIEDCIKDITKLQRNSRLKYRLHHNDCSIELFTPKRNINKGDTTAPKTYICYNRAMKIENSINNEVSEIYLKSPLDNMDKEDIIFA